MPNLRLLLLTLTTVLGGAGPLLGQCQMLYNVSVYSDGSWSSDLSAVYGWSNTVDNSTLCWCTHYSYQTTAYLYDPYGDQVSSTQAGMESTVSMAINGLMGTYPVRGTVAFYCSCFGAAGGGGPETPVDVPIPTTLTIVSGTSVQSTESSVGCPDGMCGNRRSFLYQVLDQRGQPINASMSVWDQVFNVNGQNGCQLNDLYTTTCPTPDTGPCGVNTSSVGKFSDSLSMCSTHCYSMGACSDDGCSTTATQMWFIAGHAVTTDPKTLVYKCQSITVNGQ